MTYYLKVKIKFKQQYYLFDITVLAIYARKLYNQS